MNLENLNKSQLAAVIKIARISDGKFRTEDEMREFISACHDEGGTVAERIEKQVARFDKAPAKPKSKSPRKLPKQKEANNMSGDIFGQAIQAVIDQQLAGVKAEMQAQLENMQPKERVIVLKDSKRVEIPEEEVVHPKFDECIKLLNAGLNVCLVGPAGSGKTHLAKQLARALGLSFSATPITLATSKSDVVGMKTPNDDGKWDWNMAPFATAFEDGGLHLLDEKDKFDPNIAAITNMALANDMLPLPQRTNNPMAHKHKDFAAVATQNTWGLGSTGQYNGSIRQDSASNDRWFHVYVDYDDNFESKRVNKDVLAWAKKFRKLLKDNGIEKFLSTRRLLQFTALYETNDPLFNMEYMHTQATAGWTADEIAKVKGAL